MKSRKALLIDLLLDTSMLVKAFLPSAIAVVILSGCYEIAGLAIHTVGTSNSPHAKAQLVPVNDAQKVRGTVDFYQRFDVRNGKMRVIAEVSGLTPGRQHGFHIHEQGACMSDDLNAGAHFNPHGKSHGHFTTSDRHAGDLPALTADVNGNATLDVSLDLISLEQGVNNIVGLAVIVHADPDDYQTQPDGNAGARIACGNIWVGDECYTSCQRTKLFCPGWCSKMRSGSGPDLALREKADVIDCISGGMRKKIQRSDCDTEADGTLVSTPRDPALIFHVGRIWPGDDLPSGYLVVEKGSFSVPQPANEKLGWLIVNNTLRDPGPRGERSFVVPAHVDCNTRVVTLRARDAYSRDRENGYGNLSHADTRTDWLGSADTVVVRRPKAALEVAANFICN